MKKAILLITLLFFLGTIVLAQKAILQTDCGKIECEEKGPHFSDKYGSGNWTTGQAECICRYYTPEEWELTYCSIGAGPPTEEELQTWRDCGVPMPGGSPGSPPSDWYKEVEFEIREPADLTQLTFLYHASDPDWSPDGSQIAFEGRDDEEAEPGLYLINADGTGLIKIGPEHNPSWSPVDNRILLRDDCKEGCSLILIDLDKGWENRVELASQINEQGSWSPDGKKIVYSVLSGSKSSSIWVMNSDGSEKTRLTSDEDGYCIAPSFSYDGSKIVYLKGFTSYAIGGGEEKMEPNEIWAMDSDGFNKHMIYAPGDSTQLIFQRAWNKDNKILFDRAWYHQDKFPQIWVMDSDGSDARLLVSGVAAFGDPVWDNTGTKVAISKTPPQSVMGSNIWTFSYEEPAEEVTPEAGEEITKKPTEGVEEAPKNIFQKIWEAIISFFKRIFRI